MLWGGRGGVEGRVGSEWGEGQGVMGAMRGVRGIREGWEIVREHMWRHGDGLLASGE